MLRERKILEGIVCNDRVASAYLFVGPPKVGKRAAADFLAEKLNCAKQDKFVISPVGTSLKIDQVRELQGWVKYGPSASKNLLVIVEKADSLTPQAAAAFLKTLEEPAPGVVFILLAEREDQLPVTILSRCQKIIFSEELVVWQAKENFNEFYSFMKAIKNKTMVEIFQFAAKLEQEKENREELMYELVSFFRYQMNDVGASRIMLDALRFIKRKANLKLSLENMCLQLADR